MLHRGIKINFAHRTFQWNNKGKGVAGVHCVIIDFSLFNLKKSKIYSYDDVEDEARQANIVSEINPYLVDAPYVVIARRRQPLRNVKSIAFGSMPNDGGYLLLDDHEKNKLLEQ